MLDNIYLRGFNMPDGFFVRDVACQALSLWPFVMGFFFITAVLVLFAGELMPKHVIPGHRQHLIDKLWQSMYAGMFISFVVSVIVANGIGTGLIFYDFFVMMIALFVCQLLVTHAIAWLVRNAEKQQAGSTTDNKSTQSTESDKVEPREPEIGKPEENKGKPADEHEQTTHENNKTE